MEIMIRRDGEYREVVIPRGMLLGNGETLFLVTLMFTKWFDEADAVGVTALLTEAASDIDTYRNSDKIGGEWFRTIGGRKVTVRQPVVDVEGRMVVLEELLSVIFKAGKENENG